MELVFEIEVSVVDIVISYLVGPLKYPSCLISLVILSLKIVVFRSLLTFTLEQVFHEMTLIGESWGFISPLSMCMIIMKLTVID